MENRRNYYRILHVQPDAPTEIIRTSYRTLMQRLKMHPDLGGDHEDASLINEAYATLIDPVKRAEYDRPRSKKSFVDRAPSKNLWERPSSTIAADRERERVKNACLFCQTSYSAGLSFGPETTCTTCAAPLYPAQKMQHEESSRRVVHRVPKNMPVFVFFDAKQDRFMKGITQNISLSGIAFVCNRGIPEQTYIKIDCEICTAVAIVRNSTYIQDDPQWPWQVGAEFLTIKINQSRGGFFSGKA